MCSVFVIIFSKQLVDLHVLNKNNMNTSSFERTRIPHTLETERKKEQHGRSLNMCISGKYRKDKKK